MLLNRRYWNQPLYLTPEATVELQFWLEEIGQINGQEIWHSPSAVHVVYSDASDKGYSGFMVQHCYHIAQEMAQSSTWRELVAVRRVLESLISKLKNCRSRH